MISGFMAAVDRGDKSAVFDYWEIGASLSDAMRARPETIVNELLQSEDEMMYRIMRVEWWRTCCEPGIVHEFMDAGGSRYSVQIYNSNGWSTTYTFDVFVEGLVYFGAANGWDSLRFLAVFYASAESRHHALSPPTHLRLTRIGEWLKTGL